MFRRQFARKVARFNLWEAWPKVTGTWGAKVFGTLRRKIRRNTICSHFFWRSVQSTTHDILSDVCCSTISMEWSDDDGDSEMSDSSDGTADLREIN